MNKNIINTLLAGTFVLALSGCGENTWNDHYLDGFEGGPVYDNSVEGTYQLTTADYSAISKLMLAQAGDDAQLQAQAKAIASSQCFDKTSAFPAAVALPPFLKTQAFPYYLAPDGSAVDISYAESDAQPAELAAIAGAATYTVSSDNYQAVWGSDDNFINAFAPAKPAASNLPALLLGALEGAVKGEYAVVTYNEASTNPVFGNVDDDTPKVYIESDFTGGIGDFTLDDVKLPEGSTYVWKPASYSGDYYMQASAYVGGQCREAEGWLLSPEVKLSANANAVLSFDQYWKNFKSLENAQQEATTWVREKGKAWTQLTITDTPTNTNHDFVSTGDLDLSAYNGKTIQIGFCYKSSTQSAGTWRVKNIVLRDAAAAVSRAAVADVPSVVKNAVYLFNGTKWAVATGVSVLNPADYAAMGFENNKLEDADIYIPMYLKNNLPYAQKDNQRYVVYNGKKVGLYVFDGTAWTLNNNGYEEVVGRFVRKSGDWSFAKYIGKAVYSLVEGDKLEMNRSYTFVSGDICSTPVDKNKNYGYLLSTPVQIVNNTITLATDNNAIFFTNEKISIDGTDYEIPEGTFLMRDIYDRYIYLDGTFSSFNVVDTPKVADGKINAGFLWRAERLDDGTWKIYCDRSTADEEKINTVFFSSKYSNFAAYASQSDVDVYPVLYILD